MTLVEALQAALSVEQQVVYGYGALGAHLTGPLESFAVSCLAAHLAHRDALVALVTATGATPVAASPAYQLPFRVTSRASARRLAVRLEQASAGASWDLVASSDAGSSPRRSGVGWLTDAAVRLERWGAELALPGQPD
jgi:hypothetical protein